RIVEHLFRLHRQRRRRNQQQQDENGDEARHYRSPPADRTSCLRLTGTPTRSLRSHREMIPPPVMTRAPIQISVTSVFHQRRTTIPPPLVTSPMEPYSWLSPMVLLLASVVVIPRAVDSRFAETISPRRRLSGPKRTKRARTSVKFGPRKGCNPS